MITTSSRAIPALRLALVRRPWIRWLAIAATASTAGWLVLGQLQSVDAARQSWTHQRTVFVASHEHAAGDVLVVEERTLPQAAVPISALDEAPVGIVARQRIGVGEVVTSVDVAMGSGPAATADDGDVVVAISDPLLQGAMANVSVGLQVAIHSEGIVLTDRARIVAIDGDVVFVALDHGDAAIVSAASQTRLASLAFLS